MSKFDAIFAPKQMSKIYEDDDKYSDLFWDRIDSAKKFICVTTYDIDHKLVGCVTLKKLAAAARRGVKVYLVMDDLNARGRRELVRECKAAGCKVIINNPIPQCWRHIIRAAPWRAFTRNHQKVMLVDDQCFCGSMNMSTGYSNMKYGSSVFRDLNMFLGRQEL
jgi:phosphatidylserine/phosphatidylglycerophosphate/cardiolipin synthase-like enzyme